MQNPDTDQPRETIATGEQPRTSTINDRRDSLAALREVQSDPEDKKAKARSRFTSAIRKLSHSGRKKKKLPAAATTNIECNEPVLSSGAEELSDLQEPSITDSDQKATKLPTKKKSKLTKNIFGLKKSKVGDKSSREAAEKGKKLKEERESNQNQNLQQAEKEQFLTKPEHSTNKFQFTISAKKIESKVKRQLAETDYLTPYAGIEATTTDSSLTPKTAQSTDPNSALKKKKSKGKGNQQLSPQSTQRKSSVERSIITQSLRDIPPKEKAPTKPSRLHSNCALQTTEVPTNQGAIRKTTTTTRAAVRLVSAAKPKQPKSAITTISGIKKSPPISPSGTRKGIHLTAARNTAATTKEPDLMRNLQRGHLLPKPTVTVIAINNNNNNNENNNNNHCNKQELSNVTKGEKEEHLEFPTVVKQQIQAFQPQQQLPAIAVNTEEKSQSLLPPDYPPPPPPRPSPALLCDSGYPTPEIRSTAAIATTTATTTITHQSYTSLSSTPGSTGSGILSKQKQRFLLGDINSVTSAQTNTTDDHISLAESAQHSIRKQESPPLTTTLHFALGSPVRPPPPPQQQQQQQIQTWSYTTENKFTPSNSNSFDKREHSSGDSQREDGADIRRRIHYVSQPTLYDDIDTLDLNRNYKYRYHSGISDLSLDSVADNVTLGDEEDEDREAYQSMPAFGDLTMDQDMEPTVMTSISTEKREHLYKILVIGELGTGKTSFIKRYVHQFFSQNYRATIGVDFALKVLHWDSNTVVRLQLWDIAGQERFGNMTRVYYKEAVGAFIVFDVTRSGTFDCVSKWKEDLDSKVQLPDGSPIPCILLANKCDQEKQGLVANADKIEEYVKENGFSGWFETSAKENINIDEAARALVSKILLNDKLISAADLVDGEKFNLNNTGDQSAYEEKSKCSC